MKRLILALVMVIIIVGITACGSESDDLEEAVDVELIFSYEEQSGLNYNNDAIVLIDGEEIGKVEYGTDEIIFVQTLSDGKHTVQLQENGVIRKYKSNKVKIEVDENSTDFSFSVSQGPIRSMTLSLDE